MKRQIEGGRGENAIGDGHATLTMVRLCRTKVWRPSHRNFMQSSKTTTIRANSSRVACTCNHRVRRHGIAGPLSSRWPSHPTASPLRLERVGGTAIRCAAHLAPRCGYGSQVRPSDGTLWHFQASEQASKLTVGLREESAFAPQGPQAERRVTAAPGASRASQGLFSIHSHCLPFQNVPL